MTPQEFDTYIKKGDIPSVCFIYGEEQFLVERAVNGLLSRVIDPSLKDFNLNVYYGTDSKGIDIIDSAQTLPMFSDRRVVVVKRFEQLKADALEVMLPYIQNPSTSTCLLLTGTKIDQRKKFFVELKKYGVIVEYKRLYENKLAPFIQSESSSHGKPIDPAAAELLGVLIGNNLQELSSQIEKLISYAGTRQRITVDDVKTMASSSKAFTAFEFAKYLAGKDMVNAIKSLDALFLNGEDAPMIVGAISSHFRKLWRVKELVDKKVQSPEIAKAVGISPFFLSDYISQVKNFTIKDYKQIFEEFYRCDISSKSGGNSYGLLHGLVMGVCTGNW